MDLEHKIAETLKKVASGEYDSAELTSTLLSAQGHVNELGEYFRQNLRSNPEFYNERKPENSAIACRVFAIPELLEMILEHVKIPDLLNFYQCSVSIRDSIEASSKLQTQLSLRPAPLKSHLTLPVRNMTKFLPGDAFNDRHFQIGFSSTEQFSRRRPSRRHENRNETKERTVEIHASFHLLPAQFLPHIGSRIRQMLITQPPLEEMTVALDCCPIYDYGPPTFDSPKPERKISRAGGLTVGALYDRAEELLDEHRFCPHAYSGLLEDDGTVRVGVRFVGKIALQPDDPIYLKHRESKKRREEEDRKYQKQSAKLEAFANARRAAHGNGDPIPSLEDFVASHGPDADWTSLAYPLHPQLQPFPPVPDWFLPVDDDPLGLLGTLPAQTDAVVDSLGVGTSSAVHTASTNTIPVVVPISDASLADGGVSAAAEAGSTLDSLASEPAT